MSRRGLFHVAGAIFLVVGIAAAAGSGWYMSRSIGSLIEKNDIRDFEHGSQRNLEIKELTDKADGFFWSGLVFTITGTFLQLIGTFASEKMVGIGNRKRGVA